MSRTRGPLASLPAAEYATADDKQKVLASDATDLFHLAFLLTADATKAELCLIQAMRECMANDSIFKAWLPIWTRNAVVRNGIGIVTGSLGSAPLSHTPNRCLLPEVNDLPRSTDTQGDDSAGILELSDFDRLVYVLCDVENYPVRDCALLLGRTRQKVRGAQNRASTQIAECEHEWRRFSRAALGSEKVDSDCTCGGLLA